MNEPTIFYGIKIDNRWQRKEWENKWSELTEHLAMNGYTYDTNGKDTLFVYYDEFEYVLTIIEDRELEYEIL